MGDASAILFPGQGSQRADMGALVRRAAPELGEIAAELVGADPFERASDGTRFAQPAILCAAIAAWATAGRPTGAALAGHSLGELGAAAAAGAISPADAVRLACHRGRLMEQAAAAEAGGMIALLCGAELAHEIADASGSFLANDNAPTQVVLSGPVGAIERTEREASARDVRTIVLPVTGAFHSPAMEPARDPFRALLTQVEVHPPATVLISSTSAATLETPAEIRDGLARAITEPVRWRATILELRRRGIGSFRETGPGKALTGMVRRTLDGVSASVLGPGASVPTAGRS